MTFWQFDLKFGDFILDIAILNMLLIVGVLCRWRIPFFQKYLIPSSLIAGFLGLLMGPELLGVLDFTTDRMGLYLYHLLAILFISIGLQKPEGKKSRGALHVGFLFIMSYLVQIIIGIGCMLIVSLLFMPDLIPAIGMLLPLGFGMGPGLAYSIGYSWEVEYNVAGAGSIGLTISAVGFLIAYFAGMTIVNRGIRKGHSTLLKSQKEMDVSMRTGIVQKAPLPSAGLLRFHGSSIEPLTFHLGLIGLLYLLTFFVTSGLDILLRSLGVNEQVAILWAFHFLIANLLAVLTGALLRKEKADFLLDSGLNQRLTGMFTDYLIVAAIMAISLRVAWDFAGPILLMCLAGGIATGFMLHFLTYRVFNQNQFERFTGVFGEMTGTLASGLALLRVTDPEFRTSIAQDLGLGSGMALILGFPLFVIINMPFVYFDGQFLWVSCSYWNLHFIHSHYSCCVETIRVAMAQKISRSRVNDLLSHSPTLD